MTETAVATRPQSKSRLKPSVAYIVVPEGWNPATDPLPGKTCKTLAEAESDRRYWQRWTPDYPKVIVRMETAYTVVDGGA